MERPLQDRVAGAIGAASAVTLIGLALLLGLNVGLPPQRGGGVTMLDIRRSPPPPRPEPRVEVRMNKPAKNAPSPPNIRSRPTDIVVPPPLITPPLVPPPVIAAPIAGSGAAPSAGASDHAGPGFGAGGEGEGSGGGGDGEGGDTPPYQTRGKLRFSDLPPALRVMGAARSVSVRYRVNVDGRVSDCAVTQSSGSVELDNATCRAIEARFRFRPSRDDNGHPVRSIIVETHQWSVADPDARPQP